VTRGLLSFALALSWVCGVGVFGVSASRAEEHALKVARIGFVDPESPSAGRPSGVDGFWQRLRELGWVEGQNLVIEARWGEGRYDQLPTIMAEVVSKRVDVLVTYNTPSGIAAKRATSTVPIVDVLMGDPVGTGLAASLARPGSNLTGLSLGWADIAGKWLELLHEIVPQISSVAVIANPNTPLVRFAKEIQMLGPKHGLKIRVVEVPGSGALDRAFKEAGQKTQGVLVLPDPMIAAHGAQVTAFAAKQRLPSVFFDRFFVEAGGLMAYGPDTSVMFRRAADYVDKILRGAKPSDLPIEQPTHYVLVINLKTAKALGITIPESILLRADEVIR